MTQRVCDVGCSSDQVLCEEQMPSGLCVVPMRTRMGSKRMSTLFDRH